jgi:hypothetical protein
MSSLRKEGRELRSEFGRWWMYVLVLVIVAGIIGTMLSYVGVFGKTMVERKVFENSFQYSEARKSEIAAYEAQLAEIDSQIANPTLNESTRQSLKATKAAITVRLRVARTKQ